MQTCRILDDQYGEKIYKEIRYLFHDWNYPVKKNILTPLEFVDKIQDWDIILLDNYFPWKWWEEAMGDVFLKEILRQEKKGQYCVYFWLRRKIAREVWISERVLWKRTSYGFCEK